MDIQPDSSTVDTQSTTVVLPTAQQRFPGWWSPFTFGLASAVIIGLAIMVSPSFGLGVTIGGVAAFVLAVGALVSLALSGAADRLRWGGAALALIVVGLVGVLGSNAANRFSVTQEESHHAYSIAINDLGRLGDKPPYSTNLAQAYLDWANLEINQHAYQSAIDHLLYVAKNFPTLPQAAQANSKLPGTYLAWAQYATTNQDAVSAATAYTTLLTQYASSSAAQTAQATAPATFLAAGDANYQTQHYADAYTDYQMITKNFAQSTQAASAHQKAATDLWDWSNKLSAARIYDQAATHYQDLVTNYGDTAEGKQSAALLAKGVAVIGRLFKSDSKTPVVLHTTVRISSSYTVQNGAYTVTGRQYYADTDANGYFEFPNVAPGRYLVEWRDTQGLFYTFLDGSTATAVVTVNPLQPTEIAPITTTQK